MAEATDEFRAQLGLSIGRALRALLETKHLYQSERVTTDDVKGALLSEHGGTKHEIIAMLLDQIEKQVWLPVAKDANHWSRDKLGRILPKENHTVPFAVPDIKTYCASTSCGRLEPFNFRSVYDVLGATVQLKDVANNSLTPFHQPEQFSTPQGPVQVLALSYQCQSCKGPPEVFLVRRHGVKLTLCGRAPMEHVETPPHIPERVKKYFSGAVVAFQCGQTLAGIFMLRVLIEQWAQPFGSPGDKADLALTAYMRILPQGFSDSVPSLGHWYDQLSGAIHSASEDAKLFEEGRAAIAHHFEFRHALRLPDPGSKKE